MADQFFVNLQTHLAPEDEEGEAGEEASEEKKGWFKKITGA